MRVRLVGLAALMALVLASCGGVSPEAGNPSEGIQVHGDWTIDIYNEDRTLDRSLEFENALAAAQFALSDLLTGNRSAGDWRIELGEDDGSAILLDASAADGADNTIVLTADTTIEAASSIVSVATEIFLCESTFAPDDCSTSAVISPFTATSLASPEEVAAGQNVQVEVVISFTSG